MQKKILSLAFVSMMMVGALPLRAQYATQDSTFQRYFIGSSLFLLGNLSAVNKPDFAQLNIGYLITGKYVVSVELRTWKYAWPLGIHPVANEAYGSPDTEFPGFIREHGFALAYQRFWWKGLYSEGNVMSAWQSFVDSDGKKVDRGFQVFNTYRVGYHIKLFNDRWFIEPSIAITHRPFHTEMPESFKQLDDQWSKFNTEPGLHFGFNF